MMTSYGLGVGGFIATVIVILALNVAGVIGYNMYTKKNPDKAIVAVNLDSDIVPKLRYGMLGLMFLSWIFSIACITACTFVKVTHSSSSFFSIQDIETYYYLGLRGAEYNGVCTSGDIEDNRVRTAYAFGVINNLLTTAALGGCLSVVFKVIKDDTMANKIWKTMGFLILASTWCCLFTFYVQESVACTYVSVFSDLECSLGGAGVAQVFNTMFLIGICLLYFILPSPVSEEENAGNDAAKDASKTEDDNGGNEATNSKEDMNDNIELDDVEQPSF